MKTLEIGKRIALGKILFATDFSPESDRALPYALAIARQYGAKVYGAHVAPSEDYLFTSPELWPGYLQQDRKLREEVTVRLDEQLRDVPHEVIFGIGDVWTVISRLIGDHGIDLIVVGTHGRTGARKLLLGSVAEKVFRQAPCPVLTVGPHVSCKPYGGVFEHILLATDFGKESLAALPFALSLAEEGQAQLTLLHVVESDRLTADVNVEELRAAEKRRLEDLVPPEAKPWCHAECLVQFSRPFASENRILEVAQDREVDLIVLGVRPSPGSVSTVTHLGHTTAQHIVAHAACPVLTIRA